ncbi:MAG: N-acetyltransferase [Muribaculaceae bacterium]|nr:N-acetyltransferase [Muribaculaceae bacterium]
MAVEIREIQPTRRNLLKFVHFPIDTLYRDSKYFVPPLVTDELNTLRPDKNPAFDFCEAVYYLAYRDGKIVGRIAGIINHVVNERSNKKEARFSYIDFIDDAEVVDALIDAVTRWGKSKGMEHLTGPLSFTDMDPEGMLIEGYDRVGTSGGIYNYPYYPKHMERLGFVKDADWIEMLITIPKDIPEKMVRISNLVAQRYNLTTIKYTNRKQLVADYGDAIFKLINVAYDDIFGYSPLSDKQIKHYIKMYLPFLPLKDLALAVDKDTRELIAVGISIPSMAKALIQNRGRLLPMGWKPLLRAFKHNDVVDLMLIAVKPEFQNKGVNSLLFTDLIPCFNEYGYKYAESNRELELNSKVLKQWEYFERDQHKRRRAFTKPI